ncbi:MAG: YbaK/EbsC family protein [Sphingobium sp.]|jgi:Cys-tRNA(Pro) deacylase|uniref:YbaK/EbsC family protein n=1 Tax=Sphingobium sp. TaxID=1912891 RepID=UPI000C534833|nr:YbaK/EbsC family protein [Sphingobium sp.]MBU0658459.1 YbaK/EbsC family protein [Alphaproteobacteria bacterium]MBA4753724.1 YbaK/EbsC family protein [Sphingobium sp.]MBS86910.1 cys-tRNA(pro)/cys-tRNA(cys) deacylase [Sphingobium sp.]MBU0776567.1 YbaK/EbsC family protein [Alphaproteobacteria bacterium]MBU1257369.1 YbaK/EbsC family protein [Alphaproteobacteria bacterium]
MSEASVRAWFAANAPDIAIIDQGVSTATVLEAAQALGVEPARIAKTLSLRVGDTVVLVCARGDARLHNAKAKAALGAKPRMLGADEVEAITGHPVGGVCPFGLAAPLPVYCDVSLKAFATVFPAAGSRTSSVELTPAHLAQLTDATWIDICTLPETVE